MNTQNMQNMQMSQMSSMNLMKDQGDQLALHLETLRSEYKSRLVRYKQAVTDYIDNLKVESSKPCARYSGDSRGISQECYEHIWAKSGCTTTHMVDANNTWAKRQSLNELIQDSFYWATWNTQEHRTGCYGSYVSPFIILTTDPSTGRLRRGRSAGLDTDYENVNDNSGVAPFVITDLCTGNDGKMIVGRTNQNRLVYKTSLDTGDWKATSNDCCILSVAMGDDGTVVGVGTDHKLWTKPSLNGSWTLAENPNQGEWCLSVCIAPDGAVFVVGGGNTIWRKDSYKNLRNLFWSQAASDSHVSKISISKDGTFFGIRNNDGVIFIKDSYKNMSTPWKGPYGKTTMGGITTIVNPELESAGLHYNTATSPNFDINAPIFMEIQSQAFWGENSVGDTGDVSVQECNASCATTPGCTGATYNSQTRTCNLRGGTGSAIPSRDTDYAIVPKSQQLLKIVNSINDELTQLNTEMEVQIRKIRNEFTDQASERGNQNADLIQQYKTLQIERERIKEYVSQYQTLENTQEETEIFINQKYYIYFLLASLVFIAMIVMYNLNVNPQANPLGPIGNPNNFSISTVQATVETVKRGNPFYVLFGIIMVVIIIYFYNHYFRAI